MSSKFCRFLFLPLWGLLFFWFLLSSFSLSAQEIKLEQPLLKEFPDQGFSRMTLGDYFTLEKEEFLYKIIDGLPHFYSSEEYEQLIQKLRPELKELYFYFYWVWNVSNGGVSYFYESGYGHMMPEIRKFYERIGDSKGLELLGKAENWYKNKPEEEVWFDLNLEGLNQEINAYNSRFNILVEEYIRANSHLYLRDQEGEIFPKNFSGKALSFDPLAQGLKEVEIVNNRKEGKMKIHSPEGVLVKEFNFEKGIQVGVQRYFDENGVLNKEEVLFPNSDTKEIRYYYPNGQLQYKGNQKGLYKNVGLQTYWHKNGALKYSYVLDENGNHTGPYMEYYPDGTKSLEVDRRKEEPVYLNFWDEKGVQRLKDGTGEYFYEYSYDGVTIRYEYQILDYKKHGVQKEFRNGVLVKYTEMNHGLFDGYHREYYPDGSLKEEYLMKANQVVSHRSF